MAEENRREILVDSLTGSQREAILYDKGPLLIVAGPGAGKTDTIVRRTAYLVAERKVAPEQILVTTFTNKAADELYDRLWSFLGSEAHRVHISTIHSFCNTLLSEYPDAHPWGGGYQILDEQEQFLFVYAHLRDLRLHRFPKGKLGDFLFDVISFFNLCTEERVPIETLLAMIRERGNELLELKKETPEAVEEYLAVAEAYPRYLELLQNEGLLDYGMLQSGVYEMLCRHQDVREKIAARYRYLLVDEYQDTNRLQVEIFKKIAHPYYRITVVGDDDQSIYRFRGATPSSFLHFDQDFPGAHRIDLDINFRATPVLVETALSLIRHNAPGRTEKALVSNRKRTHEIPPVLIQAGNCAEEAEKVARLIKQGREEGLFPSYSCMAILFRSVKYYAEHYLDALRRYDIPYTVVADGSFFERDDIFHLRELIKFCGWKKKWDPACFQGKMLELSPETINTIIRWKEDPVQWTDEKILDELKITDAEDRRVLREMASLRARTTQGELNNLMELFYKLLKSTGYFARCCRNGLGEEGPVCECEAALLNLAQFSRLLDNFCHHVQSHDTYRFGEYLYTLPARSLDNLQPEPEDAVQIMTVHRAKGLEFPVVIIGSAMEGRFPGKYHHPKYPIPAEFRLSGEADSIDEHLRDQRRLFYVAMTRAKDLLIVGAPEKVEKRGNGPSRFVEETGKERFTIPEALQNKRLGSAEMHRKQKGAAKLRRRLSYSALHCYFLCPLQYKLLHECNFAVPQANYFRFGSSIHKCLELIHRHAAAGSRVDLQTAEEIFAGVWKTTRWKDQAQEKKQRELGLRYIRQYAENYALRFDRIVWVEENLELPVGDHLLLQGRLDLAYRGDTGLEIVDFKVRSRKGLEVLRPEYQIETYGLAVTRARAGEVGCLVIHLLAESPGKELVVQSWNNEVEERAEERIREAAAGIENNRFAPTPGAHCAYCDFAAVCPEAAVTLDRKELDEEWIPTTGTVP